MNIDTWVERIIKEHKDDRIDEVNGMLDYGESIYRKLPSLRIKHASEDYRELLQEKHDAVYEIVSKKYNR